MRKNINPSIRPSEKTSSKHVIIKFLKTKVKEKSLRLRDEGHIRHRGTKARMTVVDFKVEASHWSVPLQVRREHLKY